MKYERHTSLLISGLVLMVSMAFSLSAHAQLTGPTTVDLYDTETYTYDDGLVKTVHSWDITGGTVVSSSSSGTAYSAQVQWTTAGAGSVAFKGKFGALLDDLAVQVNAPVVVTEMNHIRNIVPRIATTSTSTLGNSEKVESISYFDGLGRGVQNVAIRAGGNSGDIITHIEYDEFGRNVKDYLPYSSTSDIGTYRTDALSATNTYYDATAYDADFPGMTTADINPYSEKLLETSPLSRVLQQGAPGKAWKLGEGNEIEFAYATNTGTEVRRYEVTIAKTTANNVVTYVPTLVLNTLSRNNYGYYEADQLYKTVTKDENHDGTTSKNHTVEEFKDKQGRVILKRTYGASDINMDGDAIDAGEAVTVHDTYYVYDIYGNLTFVLPPKSDAHTAIPDTTELSELCYQYRYDDLNRLVEKKVPGKDWEYIVYNKLDQPILTRDANLSAQTKWLFTKYDAFGRIAYTGYITSGSTRTALQNAADNTALQFVTKSATSTTIAGTTIYYTNDTSVYPTSNITELYTINYYDNYTFDKVAGNSESAYGVTPITNPKGLPTGSKIRVLGTSQWITNVTYYDSKERSIYQYSYNATFGSTDKVKHQLDFVGNILKTSASHARTGFSTLTTEDVFTYDHMGRLEKQTQAINGASVPEVIAENTFDDLGQMVQKGVGGQTSRLQTVDYRYNVRGWLKQINDPSSLGTDLFALRLNYNTTEMGIGVDPLYNGNISETVWRSAYTGTYGNRKRGYAYSYDALNRIVGGEFRRANSSGTSFNEQDNTYDISGVVYDRNGNITALSRKGHTNALATTFGDMDILGYAYETSSNRLKKVKDTGNSTYGFVDGSDIAAEYTYDSNGNMLRDYNKGITSNIVYNHLNLPTQVTLGGGNIQYLYDATGVKLRKTVSTGGTTEYIGNVVYENGSLKFFNHAEGYVEPDGSGGYDYVYQYRDHLGNIRLSYKKSGSTLEIQEENNYYPFGLKHEGYNNTPSANYPYKYNGVEFNESLGLKLYEMDLRQYDPAIARWTSIDPVVHHSMSTYNAFDNNPIFWADPSGANSEVTEDGITFTGVDARDAFRILVANSRNNQNEADSEDGDEEEDCCKGLKKWFFDLLDKSAGVRESQWWPDDNLEYWYGEDGFTYAITEQDEFYKIGHSSWERVDVLPPMGLLIPIGAPGGSAGNLVANGSKFRGSIVYLAREGEKIIYVGITNNFAIRAAVHYRKRGIKIEPLLEKLSRADARAVEQALIETFGLGKNGGPLINRINSIAKTNPMYAESLKRGYELLKTVGF